ncbi:MAG: hypothetical protein COV60_01775 [Candidatus Magasanikbacteria bacterium CG11_big_fil_rev_8_21_14_0_20_43_7]|uniref:SCP domain-containing protein n=1 Tax=Candidatus Magasanikbacteria bacterium CG11_big_fil_rev_8_21_14_0_20_43_7 TaxID=1974654 RepID=A0A2H0N4W4_9BACT|nr:MAG: hypothetical protein COV60_01775 [Candidatus Magasanikbacteria bacterium CG11_big_fil_rev_8_21_14_0_20_43_7]
MRSIFTIVFLTGLTVGAFFVFRLSLTQTLIDIDIEELATYRPTDRATHTAPELPLFPDIRERISEPKKTISEETSPAFKETTISEIKKENHTPPPLKKTTTGQPGTLTLHGVVSATNAQRQMYGVLPLAMNTQLSSAAHAKLQDMFSKQYFEHVAPDNTEPSDWVEGAGYVYRLIGENLALGDFSGDLDLVTAWMNSPGHRANMLKAEFTEIGVAVGKGMFDGQETWLAVQVFGRPLPTCTSIDVALKTQITENQNLLEAMGANVQTQKEALEASEKKSGDEYTSRVDAYNTLVAQYNARVGETKTLVETYNAGVQAYNVCMAQ